MSRIREKQYENVSLFQTKKNWTFDRIKIIYNNVLKKKKKNELTERK